MLHKHRYTAYLLWEIQYPGWWFISFPLEMLTPIIAQFFYVMLCCSSTCVALAGGWVFADQCGFNLGDWWCHKSHEFDTGCIDGGYGVGQNHIWQWAHQTWLQVLILNVEVQVYCLLYRSCRHLRFPLWMHLTCWTPMSDGFGGGELCTWSLVLLPKDVHFFPIPKWIYFLAVEILGSYTYGF